MVNFVFESNRFGRIFSRQNLAFVKTVNSLFTFGFMNYNDVKQNNLGPVGRGFHLNLFIYFNIFTKEPHTNSFFSI